MERRRQIVLATVVAVAVSGAGVAAWATRGTETVRRGSFGLTSFPLEQQSGMVLGHHIEDNADGKPVTILDVRAATSPNVSFAGLVLGEESMGGGGSMELEDRMKVVPLPLRLPDAKPGEQQEFSTAWRISAGRGGLDRIVVTYKIGDAKRRDLWNFETLLCTKPLKSCTVPGLDRDEDELAEVGVPGRD
ncbi:MAG: hypothetical protein ACT4QF_08695 [Sporichthyaceae bacterium]